MRTKNKRHAFLDGIVLPGTERAKKLAFDEAAFQGYLWKSGDEVWISEIHSKVIGEGNFSKLTKYINELGYKIMVPTPINNMEAILIHLGFEHVKMPWESSEDFSPIRGPRSGRMWHRHKMGMIHADQLTPDLLMVDVWVREPNEKH